MSKISQLSCSSRIDPLKNQQKLFSLGLPVVMLNVFMPIFASHCYTSLAIDFALLSERTCAGSPSVTKSSTRVTCTSVPRSPRATGRARHSMLASLVIFGISNLRLSCLPQRSQRTTYARDTLAATECTKHLDFIYGHGAAKKRGRKTAPFNVSLMTVQPTISSSSVPLVSCTYFSTKMIEMKANAA